MSAAYRDRIPGECRSGYELSESRRRIPSFLMRESSVVGLMPRTSAAPPGPRTRQPVCSSARRMWARSEASSVPTGVFPGADVDARARNVKRRAARENHRTLDHVAQLAHVARPRVGLQCLHRLVGDVLDRLSIASPGHFAPVSAYGISERLRNLGAATESRSGYGISERLRNLGGLREHTTRRGPLASHSWGFPDRYVDLVHAPRYAFEGIGRHNCSRFTNSSGYAGQRAPHEPRGAVACPNHCWGGCHSRQTGSEPMSFSGCLSASTT
jgi:hypothetical protein